uniref:Uncharacterized protein n=1 Tax=Rhizophora mucronata TaxID=61149 RepID=A0A2P2LFY1_RHIMU
MVDLIYSVLLSNHKLAIVYIGLEIHFSVKQPLEYDP